MSVITGPEYRCGFPDCQECGAKSGTQQSGGETSEHSRNEEVISFFQRACLLHVLRNVATGISGVISMLENPNSHISPATFARWLRCPLKSIGKIVSAAEAGTLCSLEKHECEFVGPSIGCLKIPVNASKPVEFKKEECGNE